MHCELDALRRPFVDTLLRYANIQSIVQLLLPMSFLGVSTYPNVVCCKRGDIFETTMS